MTTTLHPYLTFNGNCMEAFNFYKSVFGGDFQLVSTFGNMPPMEGHAIPEDAKNRIMHMAYPIGVGTILMGSDTHPMMGDVSFGQNISLTINTNQKEEADRIFTALSKGGRITMPIADTFWGAYFGMATDKFGMHWMVNCDQTVN